MFFLFKAFPWRRIFFTHYFLLSFPLRAVEGRLPSGATGRIGVCSKEGGKETEISAGGEGGRKEGGTRETWKMPTGGRWWWRRWQRSWRGDRGALPPFGKVCSSSSSPSSSSPFRPSVLRSSSPSPPLERGGGSKAAGEHTHAHETAFLASLPNTTTVAVGTGRPHSRSSWAAAAAAAASALPSPLDREERRGGRKEERGGAWMCGAELSAGVMQHCF